MFRDKNVLVTGGTGMIGRQVVAKVIDMGAKVKTVSLDRFSVHSGAEHIIGDLSDFGFCKAITSDIDYVFHIAGIKGSAEVTNTKPASFFVPLLMMNTNILEACRLNQVEKIVYTSSIGAYPNAEVFVESDSDGPPMDQFPGWAKRMAELQVQAYKIQYGLKNFAIVRPSNVMGPGDGFDPDNAMVVPSLMAKIHRGDNPVVIWGDGSAIRDIAYSGDIADGIILALIHGTDGFVNLGSGQGYSIRELVETLNSFIDFNYEFDPTKPSGFPKRVMDISLARKTLGYEPKVSLLEGLKRTWQWYIEHKDEHKSKVNYFRTGIP